MPRLDNSNKHNLETLREWGDTVKWSADFNPDDPGRMSPMDVCRYCYIDHSLIGNVEHPSYADDFYQCACCINQLDETDD